MIDRINEKKKFLNINEENSDKKVIVIKTIYGAGATYFINYFCKSSQLSIEKKDSESFTYSLIVTLLKEYKDKLVNYIDHIMNNSMQYKLIYPLIGWDEENSILATKLYNYLKNSVFFEYQTSTKSKSKLIISIPRSIKKSFRNILQSFINSLDISYIIYDKFNVESDSVEICEFIGEVYKTHIIITQNIELYKKYELNAIAIMNFNSSVFYEEFLKGKTTLQSEVKLKKLADNLFHLLSGSPKKLNLVLLKCQSDLNHCKNEDEIVKTIEQCCRNYIDEENFLFNNNIIRILYFAENTNWDTLKNILAKIEVDSNLFNQRYLQLLNDGDIVNDLGRLFLKPKLKAAMNLEIFYSAETIVTTCTQLLCIINRLIEDQEYNDEIERIAMNIIETYYKGTKEIPLAYKSKVFSYAHKLLLNSRGKEAARYFAMIPDLYSLCHSDNFLKIADLLYKNGYYYECSNLLLPAYIKDMSKSEQSQAYLLLAYCNMLLDNTLSIQYFDEVLKLNDDNQLFALSGKLMSEIETQGLTDKIKTEYKNAVKQYKDKPQTAGYVSLLRNALDFENNDEAINTMEVGLKYALNFNIIEEEYKIKQNISLNLIKAQQFSKAEKYLADVENYCKNFEIKELSYPLINLSTIKIFYFFNTNDFSQAEMARDYAMKALDYASSYYAVTLSHTNFMTAISILKTEKDNKYNISDERMLSIRQQYYKDTLENKRIDNRVTVKRYLALIASARITNNVDEAKKYLYELCYNHSEKFGKHVNKINTIINEMGINDLPHYENIRTDDSCKEYALETRFEPWLISLTHL